MIPTFLACLNNLVFTRNRNTCTETFLANQTHVVPPGFEDDPTVVRTFNASGEEVGRL